ncbi:LOW QUALITY PROTEIN: Poly(ADP-ribose) polymerase and DNA-Ligase Zn-finger region [Leishmania naiffi]|uniref:Poly(ADP-ribose) polymerase and DNA-Ligase Zn-finger region n=1 Tax=Leishmania naiffi TaxID=5678 RepID=A0AAW3B4G7_9TRYP
MYMRRIHTAAPQGVVNKNRKHKKRQCQGCAWSIPNQDGPSARTRHVVKKLRNMSYASGPRMQFRDEEIESWKWRHLCCFTERQLSNAKETGDINAIQGEDDLAPADKALLQEMREGRLVGDTSILGRIGDVTHSPVADELKGKGGKVAKPKAKASLSADNRGSPSATAGEKRPRLPLRKANMANATTKDDDADSEATDEYEVAVETVTGNLKCPYGANCFRTNQEHFRQYTHGDENGTTADAAVPSDHSSAKLKPVIKRKKT